MRKTAFAVAATLLVFAGATTVNASPSRDDSWNPVVHQSTSVAEAGRATKQRAKRERYASRERAKKVRYAARRYESDASDASERRATRQRARGQRARYAARRAEARRYASESYSSSGYSGGAGPRPRAWCGWWMRTQRGGGAHLNLAWNWSKWGSPSSPQVGAVVVWRHHVGEIVGRAPNGQWLVRSGNDGGAVRTRARSVAGAVFRMG
ncbi:MAG: hypothetical protein AB7J30_18330 [Hyphomicrobium sp.]|uniref:hypothetical protein n=1 Tax=Hyphomicrobium sp. TaxID=82 RepID=UPI003D0E0391